MDMKPAYLNRFMLLTLAVAVVLQSCAQSTTPNCGSTRGLFQQYFNAGDYQQISTLFNRKTKSASQLKRLVNDMTYMGSVIGKIESMTLVLDTLNKQKYISHHQQTDMEVTFLFDETCKLSALLVQNHFPEDLPIVERNSTKLKLPFRGEWYVFWGGSTVEDNYHNAHRNMKGAIDFLIKDEQGKSFRTDGKNNEDYYAFGEEIIAPCDAEVVKVVDGVKDNKWPKVNQLQAYGNTVILKTAGEEYLLFAHLKENSIAVKEGQRLKEGTLIGLCGNSGYSTEPHLHFIVQNVNNLFHPTGAFCYFEEIQVDGTIKHDYMPTKGDRIKNLSP